MRQRHTRPFRLALMFLVVLVLASVAASLKTGATYSDTIVVVTALIGVFALYAESRRGKTIAMGEFILNLNSPSSTRTPIGRGSTEKSSRAPRSALTTSRRSSHTSPSSRSSIDSYSVECSPWT